MQWQSIHLNTHCHSMEIELVSIIFKLRKQVSRINLNGILIENFKELIKEVYKFPILLSPFYLPQHFSLFFINIYFLFPFFLAHEKKRRKYFIFWENNEKSFLNWLCKNVSLVFHTIYHFSKLLPQPNTVFLCFPFLYTLFLSLTYSDAILFPLKLLSSWEFSNKPIKFVYWM